MGIVRDTTALDPLVKEYQKVTRQLEDLLDEYIGRKKQMQKIKRKQVWVSFAAAAAAAAPVAAADAVADAVGHCVQRTESPSLYSHIQS